MSKLKYPNDYINRVICGDCLEVMKQIPDGSVDLVITDPPYMFGMVSTSGKIKNKSSQWGDLINQSLFYEKLIFEFIRILRLNGAIWMFSNWRGLPVMMKATADAKRSIVSLLVWDKQWIGPGGSIGLRPSYELVLLIPKGDFSLPNRGLPDIWRHQWSSIKPSGHPSEKPESLLYKLVDESPGDIIIDPFLGSGTTAVAAKRLGRKFIGIEVSSDYCQIAEDRLRQEELFKNNTTNEKTTIA